MELDLKDKLETITEQPMTAEEKQKENEDKPEEIEEKKEGRDVELELKDIDLIETIEYINIIIKGETERLENPLLNIDNKYKNEISTIKEIVEVGKDIIKTIQNKSTDLKEDDFEFWSDILLDILPRVRSIYIQSNSISELNDVKKGELAIISLRQLIFIHYYNKYKNDKLTEKQNKLLKHVFSEEGYLAFHCICKASISLFQELDLNNDGKITIDEVKTCCCSLNKWYKVLLSLIPSRKN